MKFLCRNCKAKYQIADEKVAGRTLRMTCQQCGEPIVVRGPAKQTGQVRQTGGHAPAPAFVPQAAGKAAAAGLAADLSRHAPIVAPPEPSQPQEEWHVAINDAPVGPLRRDEVARRIAQGVINRDSLAWREGMDDWMQIKHIAELTAMFSPVSVVPPTPIAHLAPPPPAAAVPITAPASRSDMAPIGGRKVVPVEEAYEPPLSIESIEPASEPPQEVAVATIAEPSPAAVPLGVIAQEPAAGGRQAPGWAQMFALVSGGAFILAAGALLGVRVLAPSNAAPAPAAQAAAPAAQVAAPAPPPPAAAAPAPEQKPEDNGSSVIELDMQAIDGRSGGAKKSGSAAASGNAPSEDKKKPAAASGNGNLSAEQRAMLERMGGGLDQGPSNLRAPSEAKASGAQGSGQLTAEQLSAVVLNGRKNLQRCYETALRGSASQETVRLDVEITVSPNGNVTSVHAGGKGLPGMDDCISRTVKMWRFPKSGDTTSTRFPVVFQPGT